MVECGTDPGAGAVAVHAECPSVGFGATASPPVTALVADRQALFAGSSGRVPAAGAQNLTGSSGFRVQLRV